MTRWVAGGAVALVLGLLIALEFVCRVFLPEPLFRFRFSPSLGWEQEPGATFLFIKDEFHIPVTYSSAALRDTERSLKKPDATFRVVAIGDSFTEALQVPLEDTYPKQLEAMLNQASRTGRRSEHRTAADQVFRALRARRLARPVASQGHEEPSRPPRPLGPGRRSPPCRLSPP